MPGPLAPAIIAGGAAVAGGLINTLSGRRAIKEQNKGQMKLAEYQYQKDLEQWNRMNEYNSPAQQMQRYKDAGLNPNLIYGQGSPGNAVSAAKFDAPTINPLPPAVNIPQMLNLYQDIKLKAAQTENIEANTANTQAKTMTEEVRPVLLQLAAKTGNQKLKELLTTYEPRMQEIFNKTDLTDQKIVNEKIKGENLEKVGDLLTAEQEQKAADLLYKKMRNEWMSMGITSGDHIVLRLLVRMMAANGMAPDEMFRTLGSEMKNGLINLIKP